MGHLHTLLKNRNKFLRVKYFYILELGKSNGMVGIIKQVLGKPLKESPFYGWYGTFIKKGPILQVSFLLAQI